MPLNTVFWGKFLLLPWLYRATPAATSCPTRRLPKKSREGATSKDQCLKRPNVVPDSGVGDTAESTDKDRAQAAQTTKPEHTPPNKSNPILRLKVGYRTIRVRRQSDVRPLVRSALPALPRRRRRPDNGRAGRSTKRLEPKFFSEVIAPRKRILISEPCPEIPLRRSSSTPRTPHRSSIGPKNSRLNLLS